MDDDAVALLCLFRYVFAINIANKVYCISGGDGIAAAAATVLCRRCRHKFQFSTYRILYHIKLCFVFFHFSDCNMLLHGISK